MVDADGALTIECVDQVPTVQKNAGTRAGFIVKSLFVE